MWPLARELPYAAYAALKSKKKKRKKTEEEERQICLSLLLPILTKKKGLWGHSEEATYKQGSKVSLKTSSAIILILDF